MAPALCPDPRNLANLYFAKDDDTQQPVDEYVNPKLSISGGNDVIHGRGMIAAEDIALGECLFVTPPTVHADQKKVYKLWTEQSSSSSLEEITIDLLTENMIHAAKTSEYGVANSFLVLMGNPRMKENMETDIDIGTLLGKNKERFNDELLATLTKDDMKNIILKNAFGPDFFTYKNLERRKYDFKPPHLLGVYPLAAMLNHSCSANALRSYAGETMIVHACKEIKAGTEVTWGYIPPTQQCTERRRALKKRHGFVCKCERCMVESRHLRNDILPTTLKACISRATRWNDSLVDISNEEESSMHELCSAFVALEDVFTSSVLSNEVKRYLRVAFTNFHINYFNAALSALNKHGNIIDANGTRKMILSSATQLHFAFCASDNASTAHLSVLHLCYELISIIHQSSHEKDKNLKNVKFWTEALKKAHLTRYGPMGSDVDCVRKCLIHTRTILRQRDGFLKTEFNFL